MNKVLIMRKIGGLGDILMHRMMFEDFHLLAPECKIYFACPTQFHAVVRDHPFLTDVLDWEQVNLDDFAVVYDTSSACSRYEVAMAPYSGLNRSDIWAEHCGVTLTQHNMYISINEDLLIEARLRVAKLNKEKRPTVLFAPVSAMKNKNLLFTQIEATVQALRERGLFVYTTHSGPIKELDRLNVPVLSGNLTQWMANVAVADYVVCVDTSVFHLAGGLGKPLVGIFAFTDGYVYGFWYNFILVQKHRNDGNWPCGPCYDWTRCPKTKQNPKPCITELSNEQIIQGIDKMLEKWHFNSFKHR